MTELNAKGRRLSKLQISEISLCDRGANPHAQVLLTKRNTSAPNTGSRGEALVALARQQAQHFTKSNASSLAATGLERAMAILKSARSAAEGSDGATVPVALALPVAKVDQERRQISGWASVSSVNGRPVIDVQGDMIDVADLRAAAHDFISGPRHGKAMHEGRPIMTVTESLIVDDDVATALGIMGGTRGWWICAQVTDDDTWQKVKDGKFASLSIAGSAVISEEA